MTLAKKKLFCLRGLGDMREKPRLSKMGLVSPTYVFDRQYQNSKDGISDVGEGGFDSSGSNDGEDYGDDEGSEESSLCSSMSHCTTESESEDNEEFL
jgi:hypothetical protein